MATPPSVWFAPLDGKHVTPTALAGGSGMKETAQSPYGVAVNATHVYWADEGGATIKRRALADLGTDKLAEGSSASRGRMIHRARRDQRLLPDARRLRPRDPEGRLGLADVSRERAGSSESIVVDDQYVYFTIFAPNGPVRRVPKSGGRCRGPRDGAELPLFDHAGLQHDLLDQSGRLQHGPGREAHEVALVSRR